MAKTKGKKRGAVERGESGESGGRSKPRGEAPTKAASAAASAGAQEAGEKENALGVLVEITPAMRDFASMCLKKRKQQHKQAAGALQLSPAERQVLQDVASSSTSAVRYKLLRDLSRRCRRNGEQAPRIHELMRGSSIVRQPVKPPEPSPELVKRREKLKAYLAEMEYRAMVKDLEPKRDFETSPLEVKEARRQFTVAINVLATLVACFFFGFFASTYAFDKLAWRVLFGIFCAVLAGLAELWFLLRIAMQTEEQEQQEAKKLKEKHM